MEDNCKISTKLVPSHGTFNIFFVWHEVNIKFAKWYKDVLSIWVFITNSPQRRLNKDWRIISQNVAPLNTSVHKHWMYKERMYKENIFLYATQKQPSRSVPWKRYSENIQQIYRRTPMPKYDINKVASQLYWKRTLAWVFSCKLVAYFQNTFSKEHLWMGASGYCS